MSLELNILLYNCVGIIVLRLHYHKKRLRMIKSAVLPIKCEVQTNHYPQYFIRTVSDRAVRVTGLTGEG